VNAPSVAHRELLVASRRSLTRGIRLGAALIATLVVSFGLLTTSISGRTTAGGPFFGFLVGLAALVTACSGILLTVDTISRERREGTLGFLFLTDLTGFDVLVGKLASAGLNAAGALLAVLPFMAVTQVLGGVTAGDLVRSALALLNLLWLSLSLGLAMSVRSREASRSLSAAVAWTLLLCVAFPLGASVVRQQLGPPILVKFFEASPVWALISARDIPYQLQPETFWRSLVTSHLLGWLFLFLAARQVSRVWRGDAAWVNQAKKPFRQRVRADLKNPVTALMAPTRREDFLAWGTVVLTVVVSGLLWREEFIGISWPVYGAWPFAPAYFLLKCLFAWKCCVFFYELQTGAGELLLTVPLNELQLLEGTWAGARRLVQRPLITLVSINFLIPILREILTDTATSNHSVELSVALALNGYTLLCLWADIAALGWLSARFGMRSRGAVPAFALCLATVFLPRLFLFCVPDLLLSFLVLVWARRQVDGHVRNWITGNLRPTPS